jgi:hypothetical protein
MSTPVLTLGEPATGMSMMPMAVFYVHTRLGMTKRTVYEWPALGAPSGKSEQIDAYVDALGLD